MSLSLPECLLLRELLQHVDVGQHVVEEHEGCGGQGLIQDLRVEVACLYGHLDMLHQGTHVGMVA